MMASPTFPSSGGNNSSTFHIFQKALPVEPSLRMTISPNDNKDVPVRKKRVKTPDKPSWLTTEILQTIKHRDPLKKLVDQGKIPRGIYNKIRTKVVRMVNKAKSLAITNELEENRQNSRLL